MISVTPQSGGAPTIFDAVVQSVRSKDVDVTEHPVEQGSNVSDHVRPKAEELRIEGVISDFHLPGNATSLRYGPGGDASSEDTYAVLEGYRDAGTLLQVSARGKTFSNLVIMALQRTDTKDAADSVKFTMSMKEIRIVSTQVVPLTKPKITAAKPKADTGKQAGQPATAAEVRQSTLAKLDDVRKAAASGDTNALSTKAITFLSSTFGSH